MTVCHCSFAFFMCCIFQIHLALFHIDSLHTVGTHITLRQGAVNRKQARRKSCISWWSGPHLLVWLASSAFMLFAMTTVNQSVLKSVWPTHVLLLLSLIYVWPLFHSHHQTGQIQGWLHICCFPQMTSQQNLWGSRKQKFWYLCSVPNLFQICYSHWDRRTYASDIHFMTSRELTSGFDFLVTWSSPHGHGASSHIIWCKISLSRPKLLIFFRNSRWRPPPSWIFSLCEFAIPACW